MLQVVVEQDNGCHGLDNRDGAGYDAGVVSAVGGIGCRLAVVGDALGGSRECGGGLESDSEVDIFAVRDAALYAARVVGECSCATLLRDNRVVGLRAAHGCGGKACAVLKSLGGVDAEHGFTQIGMELVEYRFAPAGRYAPDDAGDDAANAVALGLYGLDDLFHGAGRRRVRATHGVVVDVRKVVLAVVAGEGDCAYLRGVGGYRDTHAVQYLQGDGSGYAAHGCFACNGCKSLHQCVTDDSVNEALEKMKSCDGIVIGSPVYFASANGTLISFLDRLFCADRSVFEHKVGAAVVTARRAGNTATFDELNKYLFISNMFVAGSNYWNEVHGNTPDEVEKDLEGLQTMRILGRNMAYLIRTIAESKVKMPPAEKKIKTNFTR